MAGLSEAVGDKVFLIDCDLEVSPSILVEFYAKMESTNADVVYAVQTTRKSNIAERILGGLFWKIFNLMSETQIPENVLTERLMKKEYVKALIEVGDRNIFMAGLMYWVGYDQIPVAVNKKQREGSSTYSLTRRLDLLIQAITSFSEKPLNILFKFGVIVTMLSAAFGLYFLILKLLRPETILLGYASLFLIILFFLGLMMTSMGLLGLYISKLFIETKGRPRFLIKRKY